MNFYSIPVINAVNLFISMLIDCVMSIIMRLLYGVNPLSFYGLDLSINVMRFNTSS